MQPNPYSTEILRQIQLRKGEYTFRYLAGDLYIGSRLLLKDVEKAVAECIKFGEDPVRTIVGQLLDAVQELSAAGLLKKS